MSTDEILLVLAIFLLRVLNNSMGTLRVIVMTSGRRGLSFVLAFTESLVFAYTASKVLTDLSNIPNLIAYAGGFAVGNFVGIYLDERLVTGYVTINIISMEHGHNIAVSLREAGFGVTETLGEGGTGTVTMLRSVVHRQDVQRVFELVQKMDDSAFITTEEARAVQAGWLRTGHRRHYH